MGGTVIIERFAMRNFRSYERFEGTFNPVGAVIAGPNGSGKSNFLEALAYPSLCRSFRGVRDTTLLRDGAAFFWVRVRARNGDGVKQEVSVLYRDGQKQWNLDGRRTANVWEAAGRLKAVSFSWSDLALVKEGPGRLRSYLDAVALQLDREHLRALRGFLRSIRQRNDLLNQHAQERTLRPWEELLATHGAAVARGRQQAVERINVELAPLFSLVFGREGEPRLSVASDAGSPAKMSDQELLACYRKVLRESREHDRAVGHTRRGPHRDRVRVMLAGREARFYASDGEQRVLALCLRLAQATATPRLVEPRDTPVLVLDDPLAGLDDARINSLSTFIDKWVGQVFMSCQDPARARRFTKPILLVGDGDVWEPA
jgi:DNA replication and repair protein RecF